MEKTLTEIPSNVLLEPPSDQLEQSEPEFRRIGPSSKSALIGVKYDTKSSQYLSYIKIRSTGHNQRIGLFFTEEQAAIAHDMQSLKTYGLLAGEDLNYGYSYEVQQLSAAINKTIRLKLSGVIVNIECDKEEQQISISQQDKAPELSLPIPESVAETVVEAEAVDSLICSPVGTAAVLPGKTDVNRRWPERLVSSFFPTAAFAYEVTFMQQSSLGLQLRPLLLTYSVGGGKRTLGCCVVIDASQSPSQLVQAGDILVSVNGLSLIGAQPQSGDMKEASGGFSFDTSVKAISQAVAPRTIRFLRTAGLSVNQQLSPAEASLLVADSHPIAKFTVEQSVLTGGGPNQTQLYLDNQVPLTMKRMLQGQRIQWETIPQAAQPTASAMNIPFQHNAFPAETEVACGVGGVGGGVYKDRYRWLAVLFVPQGGGQGRHHLLGRFDSEDEANVAYKWALEEVRMTGAYSSRRRKRLSIMLDGSAVSLSSSSYLSATSNTTLPPIM